MKRIFVVGSINIDLSITAPYMPKSGETLTGSGFMTCHGGKGANQAVAAKKLGGDVLMCGCLGNDAYGHESKDSMSSIGINTSYVKLVDEVPSGTAVIILADSDNRIIVDQGANTCLNNEQIDDFLKNAHKGDIYLTQLECPIDVIGYGLKRAKEKGMFVVLNPAPANKNIIPYIKYCDLITPNETELEILGGLNTVKNNVKNVVITLGSKGFRLITDECDKVIPCIKVDAVDTVAAGDTLVGGLVAKFANGASLEESTIFGSKAASIACTRKGAQTSIPTIDEVKNF